MTDTPPRPLEPVVGPRTARRQARQRRQLLIGAVVVVALLAAVVVAVVQRSGGGGGDGAAAPAASATPTASVRTQRVVLVQLVDTGGAISNVLLAHDPATRRGAGVLVPSRLLADVPGAGSMPLGRAVTLPGATLAADALADLLEVTIDGTWRVTPAGLAVLVDALGGITVDVDTDVLAPVPGGGATVGTSAGQQQRLDGAAAARYAAYLAAGEQDIARLPRLQDVLEGLLTALPDRTAVPGLLTRLASGSRTTLPAPELTGILAGVRADAAAGTLAWDTVPVVPIEGSGGDITYRLDEARATALVDRLLAASVPDGVRGGGRRVRVLNGVGTPGLGEQARALLVPAGFAYAGSSNVPGFGVGTSEVLVSAATPEALALGERVAAALGLPASAVKASAREQTIADVIVVLGADFAPAPSGTATP